LTTHC